MFQKGLLGPVFSPQKKVSRPLSEVTEIYDTEFEEDSSDFEEDWARRSEESVSRRISSL